MGYTQRDLYEAGEIPPFCKKTIKQERLETAKDLDWSAAHDVYVDNAAKFEEEYAGKIWKWTAMVFHSEAGSCQMANEISGGFPLNSIDVYMDNNELMRLLDF